MYKYLLFSQPKSLVFYSSATAIDRHSDYYFAVNKMKQLIFREGTPGADKSTLSLDKLLKLSKSENVNLLKIISIQAYPSDPFQDESPRNSNEGSIATSPINSSQSIEKQADILIGTNKMQFFMLHLSINTSSMTKITKLEFSYKSILKRLSSNSRLIQFNQNKVLLITSNYILYLNKNDTRFKLLKVFKEKILGFEFDCQNQHKIYVLCKKELIFAEIREVAGGNLAVEVLSKQVNKRKFVGMKSMKHKIVFFNKLCQIRIYEKDKDEFTYKIEIMKSFKQNIQFDDLYIINDEIICFHDEKYLYSLSLKMNKITQIVNVSDCHHLILPNGQILNIQTKSENLISVSEIKIKTYFKSNKINKYLSLSKYEKLKIIFAYMSKKYLKMYKFQDYNKVIYDLLLQMNISNVIVKQPEFKSEVLKLYNMISDFSVKSNYVSPPVSPIINDDIKINKKSATFDKRNSLQILPNSSRAESKSGQTDLLICSSTTKNSSQNKFMVHKPLIEIKLPRKHSNGSRLNENLALHKIKLKGNKHYVKFMRFKSIENNKIDCVDSIYARYQSRLERIHKGKYFIQSFNRFYKRNDFVKADLLFFYSHKFDLKNNFKLLYSIFIGLDLYFWMCPPQRNLYFRRIRQDVLNKHNSNIRTD